MTRTNRKGLTRVTALVAGAMLAIGGGLVATPMAHAAGTTHYVDQAGTDSDDCTTDGIGACKTIQRALDNAASGDTIKVAPGHYVSSGHLTINKSITLLGPQAGVNPVGDSPRDGTGEAVIQISSEYDYVAIGIDGVDEYVIFDGFTFEETTIYRGCTDQTGTVTVRNNIINSSAEKPAGSASPSSGALPRALWTNCGNYVVENNILDGKNQYELSSAGYMATQNGTITWTGNDVRNWDWSGVIAVWAEDVTITGNSFTNIKRQSVRLAMLEGTDNEVSGNIFTNSGAGPEEVGAIGIVGTCEVTETEDCADVPPVAFDITGNTIRNAHVGLSLAPNTAGYAVNFSENSLSDISELGVANGGPAQIAATHNWWGTGTDVEAMMEGDGITFEPYYTDPEMDEMSDGTGGGGDGSTGSLGSLGAGSLGSLFGS